MGSAPLAESSYTFKFPVELEQVIFEYADHHTALQLITVARRVRHWIEPLLYEYIPANKTHHFLRTLADDSIAKSAEFYASHVKAICITSLENVERIPSSTLYRVFTTFTGLQTIAIWESWLEQNDTIFKTEEQKSVIGKDLRPKKLSTIVERFFAIQDIPNRYPDFSMPFFSQLTHLEILDPTDTWRSWKGLELLPCLTHLSFEDDFIDIFDPRKGINMLIYTMLKECRTLQVILFILYDQRYNMRTRRELEAIMACRDPRCVVLPPPVHYLANWDAPFLGKPDLWSVAEDTAREQLRAYQIETQQA